MKNLKTAHVRGVKKKEILRETSLVQTAEIIIHVSVLFIFLSEHNDPWRSERRLQLRPAEPVAEHITENERGVHLVDRRQR